MRYNNIKKELDRKVKELTHNYNIFNAEPKDIARWCREYLKRKKKDVIYDMVNDELNAKIEELCNKYDRYNAKHKQIIMWCQEYLGCKKDRKEP